jgi:hypothetical protein
MFKSLTQPFCRYCGKAIRKWTTTIYFGKTSNPAHPETKADAQRLINQQVLSVSYAGKYWWKDNEDRRWIDHVTTWDGQSYHDQFFCGPKCAEHLGRLMARNDHCTVAYKGAVIKQHAKEVA